MSNATEQRTESVQLVREINAPAGKVFDAFTDPQQLVRWIGPGGPEATRVESTGSVTDVWIDKDEGEKHHFHWEVTDFDPPRFLALDFAFGPPIGESLTADRSRLTLEIRTTGPETSELTLTHERLTVAQTEGVSVGWRTITDRLADLLEGKESE